MKNIFKKLGNGSRFVTIHGNPWPKQMADMAQTPAALTGMALTATAAFCAVAGGHDNLDVGFNIVAGLLTTASGVGMATLVTMMNIAYTQKNVRGIEDYAIDREGRSHAPIGVENLLAQTQRLQSYTKGVTFVFGLLAINNTRDDVMRIASYISQGCVPNPYDVSAFCLMTSATVHMANVWHRCHKLTDVNAPDRYVFADTSIGKREQKGQTRLQTMSHEGLR